MLRLGISIGPVNTQLETDEKLSFDGIETILSRVNHSTLITFNAHLAAMVKYENYDNDDTECEVCSHDDADLNEEI
jgi:hypothetical protein